MGVEFPDLPGCFSAGDTQDEAIENAHEALQLYAEVETSRGRRLPEPRPFDVLYSDPEIREEAQGAPIVGVPLREASILPGTRSETVQSANMGGWLEEKVGPITPDASLDRTKK